MSWMIVRTYTHCTISRRQRRCREDHFIAVFIRNAPFTLGNSCAAMLDDEASSRARLIATTTSLGFLSHRPLPTL